MTRIILLAVQLGILIGYMTVAVVDWRLLLNHYLFIGYLITVTLSLPVLLSRNIFRRPLFSSFTLISFGYYPLLYLVAYLVANLAKLPMTSVIVVEVIMTIALWNLNLAWFLLKSHKAHLDRLVRILLRILIIVAIYWIVVILIRQLDTVVALDYLQHQTVVNGMLTGTQVCLLPVQCSNLFLQPGYTTFYHTVLGFAGGFLGVDLTRLFFLFDLLFPAAAAFVLFKLFLRYTKSLNWAMLGTSLSLLVFINGAYDFIFFLPQTFAFFLFLIMLSLPTLTVRKLILAAVILVPVHFVMGSFLLGILILKYLFIDRYLDAKKLMGTNTLILVILLLPVQFLLVLNLIGFSFERLFQISEINIIGSPTNLYFPDNVVFLASLLGANTLILIAAVLFFWRHRQKLKFTWLAFLYLAINLATYFFAVTYANKFLIGFGVFSAILIMYYVENVKLSLTARRLMALLLVLSFSANFIVQYKLYTPFYKQRSGVESAIVPQDMAIINYLKQNPQNCLIVSDPLTQLVIASYAGATTARAQYLKIPSREAIEAFNDKPTRDTWQKLTEIEEVKRVTSLCYLYTSRLEQSHVGLERNWLQNIYIFTLDNYLPVSNPAMQQFFADQGKTPIFKNENFILYQL